MNYYQSLMLEIDKLKSEGKLVKFTVLPSQINNKRKPIKF